MAPTSAYMVQTDYDEPISRTYQYRKVMKPMLERKRRARINRCLDELKELMVTALQSEGENVSKLEKADILELTVRHLHQLKRQHQLISTPEQSYADRFRAGFTHCAAEVSHFLSTASTIKDTNGSTIDPSSSAKLLQHLSTCIRRLETTTNNATAMLMSQQQSQPPQQQQQQSHQQYYQQQQQQQLTTPVILNQPSPQQLQQQQYTPPTSPTMMLQHYQQQHQHHQQQQQQQPQQLTTIDKSKFIQQNSQQIITTIHNNHNSNSSAALKATMWRPW